MFLLLEAKADTEKVDDTNGYSPSGLLVGRPSKDVVGSMQARASICSQDADGTGLSGTRWAWRDCCSKKRQCSNWQTMSA